MFKCLPVYLLCKYCPECVNSSVNTVSKQRQHNLGLITVLELNIHVGNIKLLFRKNENRCYHPAPETLT